MFSQVLIRPDGSAVVDGAPFPVPDGEPVHVAVLDAMHRHAQAAGEPVEALITDEQEGYATRIEVAPDGSSRIVRQERHDAPRETPPAAPPDIPGTAMPVPVPVSVPVPEELTELVRQITHAVDTGAPERATALAFRLREHAARAFGAEHPFTLEAYALEAFVAHRGGNHPLATATCLELARIRHGQGDPRAHDELMRAVAAWRLIDNLRSAVEQGRALLEVWSRLAEQGGGSPVDAEVARDVNRRIHALAAQVGPRRTGAA
jgi:hypothetical protein